MNRLRVPDGFKVEVYARNIPYPRTMSLGRSGVLYGEGADYLLHSSHIMAHMCAIVASYNFKGISGDTKENTAIYAVSGHQSDDHLLVGQNSTVLSALCCVVVRLWMIMVIIMPKRSSMLLNLW
jgi:hypothetical protein